MTPVQLASLVERFAGQRIIVIGDMVADVYIVGSPARISREAPVLILHHHDEFVCPGQAANVAVNLAALGASVSVGGYIGDDDAGERLCETLRQQRIDVSGLIVDRNRPTATKTRVVGGGEQVVRQQIVRIDRVDRSPVDPVIEERLAGWATEVLAEAKGLIVSDYENGVMGPAVVRSVLPKAGQAGVITTVDSHGDLYRFRGVTIATPNQPEAEATLGRRMTSPSEIEAGGEELREGMDAELLLVTRGSEGMSLFQRGRQPVHLPPTNVGEVFDPTGAGDTVAAVITLALATGADPGDAALLSNVAAGEVVKKLGNATVSVEELGRAATTKDRV